MRIINYPAVRLVFEFSVIPAIFMFGFAFTIAAFRFGHLTHSHFTIAHPYLFCLLGYVLTGSQIMVALFLLGCSFLTVSVVMLMELAALFRILFRCRFLG